MKLKDYLKQFEGMDPEAEMIHTMSVGCCGDSETLEDPDVEARQYVFKKEPYSHVQINYPSFEFLNSCRKYGSASGIK